MNNFSYLPNKSDWEFWFTVSKDCGVISSNRGTFDILSPNTLRYLMILSRQLFLAPHPHYRDLITEMIEEDGLLAFSEMENITGAESPSSRDRIISSHLKDMSVGKNRYIDIYQAKEWEKKYKLKVIGPEGLHGSTALYQATPKGILAYECGLNLPFLALSNFGLRKSASPSDFFVSYGILARERRFRWSREYMQQYGFRIGIYQEEIIDGIHMYLGRNADRFWSLSSPQLLLLREYFNLVKYIELLEKNINEDRKKLASEEIDLDEASEKYLSLAGDNIGHSKSLLIAYLKQTIDGFILPEWRRLGYSKNDLASHLPPRDVFI